MAADGHAAADDDPTGEYVVDIAEYYGDPVPDAADKIYRQLKTRQCGPTSPGLRPASRTPRRASPAGSRRWAKTPIPCPPQSESDNATGIHIDRFV
jgi:hypothetical protein